LIWTGYTQCQEVKLGYPVPEENKYRNLALQVEGVSKAETTKYVHESLWTMPSNN
jgi:hypothetical protein